MSDPTLKSNPGPKSTPSAKGETHSRRPPRQHRLNLRAVVILAVLILVGTLGFLGNKTYQGRHQGAAMLAEAKQLLARDPKQPQRALIYLNSYIEMNPKDMDALDLKSKVLFDVASSFDQAANAIQSHNQVVRSDTQVPRKRQEARRRLVQLNLRVGQPNTAHTLALDLVASDNATAADYRLLGATLMVLGARGVATTAGPQGGAANAWDEAIKSYEKAQELDPGNIEGARNLAYLYQNQRHNPVEAQKVLEKLLEQANTNDEKALAHSALYDYFAATNDGKEAGKHLEAARLLKPKDPDILLKAAVDALRKGEIDDSREFLKAIPDDVRKLAFVGELDVLDKKIDNAIQDWRAGLKITGGTSDVLTWRLAYIFLRLGRLAEAEPLIDQYHRLTDRTEPIPKAVYLDALMLLRKNKPAAAIEKLEAIRLKINDNTTSAQRGFDEGTSLGAEVAYTLGQAYEAINRDPQALAAYQDAAKIVREARGLKWADPWIGIANVYQRANRLGDAAAALEDGLISIPGDSALLVNLGRIRLVEYTRKPKGQRSYGDIDKILKAAGDSKPAAIDLIKLQVPYLVTEGRLDEALDVLAKATDRKNDPKSPELWAIYADVLRRKGEPTKALDILDRGTAAVGEQALLRIARAQMFELQGRDTDAYETLEGGIGLVPPEQRPTLLKALGDTHRRRNDMSAARKAYAEWAKLAPKDSQPQLLLLELALADGDEPAIRAAAAAAKKIGGLGEQLAEAFVLLKDPTDPNTEDPKARDERLAKAGTVINAIVQEYPGRATGYLLRGQLLEKQGKIDEAILAYRQAREHNGGPDALRYLFSLLARSKRFDELRKLRNEELYAGELTPELERLAISIALALDEKDEVKQMIRQVVSGDPQGLITRMLQVGVLNALGEPKEAEEILRTLIQQRPDELDPRLALLIFQINQKQYQKAAETVEQIRELTKIDRAEFVWASCYAMIGNTARAIEYYKQALKNWPKDQEVRQRAVNYLHAIGRDDEAEVALRELLQREPNHAWGRRELAQILSARRNDMAAWNEALKLIGDKPTEADTAEDRLVRATVFIRGPNREQAQEGIGILEDLVVSERAAAVSLMAHELLARIYTDANDLAKARPHVEAAAARSNDPNLIAFYVELLLRDKQAAEALKQADRLAQLEPDSLRVLDLRSRSLYALGRSAEAATLLEAAFVNVDKLPNGEGVARKIVELLIGLNQLEAAERTGRRLAELWPKNSWLFSQVLVRRDKLDEALKFCKAAVESGAPLEGGSIAALVGNKTGGTDGARLKQVDAILSAAIKQLPGNLALLFAQANIYRTEGRYTDAAQVYRALLTQYPDNIMVLNNMAWTLSEDLNQPAEGLERIDAALKHAGRDSSLLDTRGVILTRLGKFDQAIGDLEAAVVVSPAATGNPAAAAGPAATAYYHLARAYQKAGRIADFQKYRTRAKEAGLTASQLQPSERAEMDKLMNQ